MLGIHNKLELNGTHQRLLFPVLPEEAAALRVEPDTVISLGEHGVITRADDHVIEDKTFTTPIACNGIAGGELQVKDPHRLARFYRKFAGPDLASGAMLGIAYVPFASQHMIQK